MQRDAAAAKAALLHAKIFSQIQTSNAGTYPGDMDREARCRAASSRSVVSVGGTGGGYMDDRCPGYRTGAGLPAGRPATDQDKATAR
jgi:hypothetical protein